MPPLEQSLSSSYHSVGSSSKRIFARVRHNLALSPSRSVKPTIGNVINSNSINKTSTPAAMNLDLELKTAKDACVGAIMALVHYLSQHKVSSGTFVDELQDTIRKCDHFQYDSILQRMLQQCLRKLSKQIRNEEFDIIHMLVFGCWQTQHRYAQVQYQRAYRCYHNLRFNSEQTESQLNFPAVSGTASTGTAGTMNGARNLEKALHHQIQMAEYVCTCQKEMILCTRTHEQQQHSRQDDAIQWHV